MKRTTVTDIVKLRKEPKSDAAADDVVLPDDPIEVVEKKDEWSKINVIDPQPVRTGFVRNEFIVEQKVEAPDPKISQAQFVVTCVQEGREAGVNAHFLLSVAFAESEIKNVVDATTGKRGPFQIPPTIWEKYIEMFGAETGIGITHIDSPFDQVSIAARAAKQVVDNLSTALDRPATAAELYLAYLVTIEGAVSVLKSPGNAKISTPLEKVFASKPPDAKTYVLEQVLQLKPDLFLSGGEPLTVSAANKNLVSVLTKAIKATRSMFDVLDDDEKPTRMKKGSETVEPGSLGMNGDKIGILSQEYESRGSPTIIGHDPTGGFSYGHYQIATKTGTCKEYMKFLSKDAKYTQVFTTLSNAGGNAAATAGQASFRAAWEGLGGDPAFVDSQHGFIQVSHYDPLARKLGGLGLPMANRSFALKNVVWSVAVQHRNAGTTIFKRALKAIGSPPTQASNLTDKQIIDALYAERSKVHIYFKSSPQNIRRSVANRFVKERQKALSMLAKET